MCNLGLELVYKKEFWVVSKALIMWFGNGAVTDWETTFEIRKVCNKNSLVVR